MLVQVTAYKRSMFRANINKIQIVLTMDKTLPLYCES